MENREFAKISGIPASVISVLKNNRLQVSETYVEKLADTLGMSRQEFVAQLDPGGGGIEGKSKRQKRESRHLDKYLSSESRYSLNVRR